jgi:hypothetical protein
MASPSEATGRVTVEPWFASDRKMMEFVDEEDVSEPRCYMHVEAIEDRKVWRRSWSTEASEEVSSTATLFHSLTKT